MAMDEVDVAADGFFEQFKHAMLRMILRHPRHGVMEILSEFEDHGIAFAETTLYDCGKTPASMISTPWGPI